MSRSIIRIYASDTVMNRGGEVEVVVKDAPCSHGRILILSRSRFRRSLDTFAELFLSGRKSTRLGRARSSSSLPRIVLSARFHFCRASGERAPLHVRRRYDARNNMTVRTSYLPALINTIASQNAPQKLINTSRTFTFHRYTISRKYSRKVRGW